MKLHSITKIPKKLNKTQLKRYKKVNSIDELKPDTEVFKIKGEYIVGVDFCNNDTSKKLIEKEIEKNIIFIL